MHELRRPVFDLETRDAFEFTNIVSDERELFGQCMCGDPEIVITDDLTLGAQVSFCLAVFGSSGKWKWPGRQIIGH